MRYKPLVLLVVSVLVACVSGVAYASDTDPRVSPIESPLPAMTPSDAHCFTAQTALMAWHHLRAVPLTAEDWESIKQ